uniref:Uncharacterized protein n=1 Tax=Moniliophthora roreri TaxID=221103 RepID=A0A0W0FYC7_MONRR
MLLLLGLEESNTQYQKLENNQLWARNHGQQRTIGESEPNPWYWHTSTAAGASEEDQKAWVLEMNWVKWFCDHATLDRYREEVEILEAEYACVQDREGGYASKQAAVHQAFQANVVTEWSQQNDFKKELAKRKRKTKLHVKSAGKQKAKEDVSNMEESEEEGEEAWDDLEAYICGASEDGD